MTLDLKKEDLYALLGINEDATNKDISKGYRKTALKCHPDKNPDNPQAANEFQRLSKAFEILSDAAARAAYDKTRKAKQAAAERHKVLDGKRKKFKEDLEARERAAHEKKDDDLRAQKNLEAEIARLRKQGSSLLEQEQEYLREELRKEFESMKSKEKEDQPQIKADVSPKLKITWNAQKGVDDNGGYSYGKLHALFSKYGEVTALVLSAGKKGRGIVEYRSPRAAAIAFKNETGEKSNPLTLKWLSGKPEEPVYETVSSSFGNCDSFSRSVESTEKLPSASMTDVPTKSSYVPETTYERDFESLVLMKMRQAEERKRLIERMQKEDGD